jgi:hypothetical protein
MTTSHSSLDAAEKTLAVKRVSRWSHGDREFVVELTPAERNLVMTLVALLDARPNGPARAEA